MEEYINIGKLDINKYCQLCENELLTDEVIITYKQIEHINEKRLNRYLLTHEVLYKYE